MSQLVVTVLTMLAVIVAAALPAGAQNPTDVVWHKVPELASWVATYWTPERMKNARPLLLRNRSGAPGTPATGAPPSSNRLVIAYPGGPGSAPYEETISLESVPEPLAGTSPFTFTRYRLFPNLQALYQQFPYRTAGKVFFTIPGQGDFVCSGAVVNTTNKSVVWTAGHCVFTAGVGFHTNFLFAPARRNAVDPYATWTANTLATTSGWQNSELLEYDHGGAFMNLGGPGGNRKVGDLGFLGFLANAPRAQVWHVLGYPAAPPFDGEHLEICATHRAVDDLPTGGPADPRTIGTGCDQTGGSSGGPWVTDLTGETTTGNFLNGNVSYGYIGAPNELYGPYFGDAAINLRNFLGGL